jgi:hypothetical protein
VKQRRFTPFEGKIMQENLNTDIVLRQESALETYEETLDTSTLIPRTQLERLVETTREGTNGLPLHLQQLQQLPYSNELKEQLVSAYSAEAQKLARYMNKEIECLGMVVWEVPPYMAKPVQAGDPPVQKPGYFQVRILTSQEDQDGNYVVLRSSSVNIAVTAFFVIQSRGAWLFDKPIFFRFGETNGGMHQMVKSGDSLRELKDLIRKGKKDV